MDFYDLMAPVALIEVSGLEWFGGVGERAVRNGARHGTPILSPPAGVRPDPRINLFFRTGSMAGASPATWRRYAYSLAVWLDFLSVFDRCWDKASVGDVEAFKDWRLTDVLNGGRIRPTSFDTDRAALNCFYGWAATRCKVVNPVATIRTGRRPNRRGGLADGSGLGGRDPLRPAGATRRQVKWMLRPAFEQWRDIGLRGYGFDGLRRSEWRGYNEDRDTAFVDGLYGTGLRLQEWASILDVEVPSAVGPRSARLWLSAACIKGGGEGRVYRIPRPALTAVHAYLDPLEGSRAEVIRRARRAGRYADLAGIRVVTAYNARSKTLRVQGDACSELLPLDVIGPDERRRLFRATSEGLEPLAVWLAPNGMPKKAHGWEDTFGDANARVERAWRGDTVDADSEHMPCPLWARPHMLRHSFCLKWFCVLSLVWELRVNGFTSEELKDLREQFGDIWYQLATLMGHATASTTRDYYLEPFTGLQVDYLMSLLDEDEKTGIDALVRAVAQDTGQVLTEVPALPGDGR
ncbi:hypothetical protein [Kribbella aluminosa]|uniref:hypothetical protein n=1 Tax=Kribbella aluminosa TaxID=416017 RepID=UPI0031E2D307